MRAGSRAGDADDRGGERIGADETLEPLTLTATAVREMIAHARDAAPAECCGLLVGREDGAIVIDEAVRTRNAEASPTRYLVDAEDHLRLIRRVRGTERAIVGAYHSHPHTAAVPSPTDVAQAWWPDLVHVIVSLAGAAPVVRAWRIEAGAVRELRIVDASG